MRYTLLSTLLAWAVPSVAMAAKVAVLPIEARSGVDDKTAQLLTDYITNEAAKRADLQVLGPSDIKAVVTLEETKSAFGCSDSSCLAEIGAALGVDAVLTGSVGQLGATWMLNLSLVSTKGGAGVLGRASDQVQGNPELLLPLVPYLVATALAGIPGGPPPPPRPNVPAAGPVAAAPGAGSSSQPAKAEEGSGGSSMPRRLAGLGVAGLGVVLGLGALALGTTSLAYLASTKVGPARSITNLLPFHAGGMALAGGADVLGLVGLAVLLGGVVLAALP